MSDDATITERVHELMMESQRHPDYVESAYSNYHCPYVKTYTLNDVEYCECMCSNPKPTCPIKFIRGGVHDDVEPDCTVHPSCNRDVKSLPNFISRQDVAEEMDDAEDIPYVQRGTTEHRDRPSPPIISITENLI